MKTKGEKAASIIGGADGPTSIFMTTGSKGMSLKDRFNRAVYKIKKKKAEKRISANPHSLSETVHYAKNKYALVEVNPGNVDYSEQKKCLRESLILEHKSETLGELQDIPTPDYSDESDIKDYFGKVNKRSEFIAAMPDDVLSMDFHLYELRIGNGVLRMVVDHIWNIYEISYSGSKIEFNRFKKISKELYSYYGVGKDDIENKTKRYSSLVAVLTG